MRIAPISLMNQSKLINDYRTNNKRLMDFFDYHPYESSEQRVKDINERTFLREQLSEVLHTINNKWDAPQSTMDNIENFKKQNSVVVIGGQQAGMLTGPLYTINKIISIIQLAKKKELELNIPVIPVFWIAGEDHDFDEINHIFMPGKSRLKKIKVGQRPREKNSVSHIDIDKDEAVKWIERVFSQLNETYYTKELYIMVNQCLGKSTTYTDFFARLIFQLFAEDGLVLIDSAHPLVRELEKTHFVNMIENQPKISSAVYQTLKELKQNGYQIALDADENDANLFYHQDNERILLTRNERGEWVGKQNEVLYSTEEMIEIANNNPEKLSNNVVTRPLMQELLFPTLAFIGGPGEIAYWAALKKSFHSMDIKMPPVLPRLSFTFVESRYEKIVKNHELDIAFVVNYGVQEYKEQWLKSKSNPQVEKLTNGLKESINKGHEPLRKLAKELRSDIGELAEKNLQYLFRDIDFLEGRIMKGFEDKYQEELRDLEEIHQGLHPDGLQERMWNPITFLNKYGYDFIREVIEIPCSFENEHYLVHL